MTEGGRLVLVATPIGNLGDLSPRAAEALAQCDVVCCEDTRRTRQLLTSAGIRGKVLLSLHAHNEQARLPEVLGRLEEGQTVALVSDAGTPTLSDPGARLVSAAAEQAVEVTVVPGPNAALAALVVSGLPTERFCFEGFLPRRGPERRRRIAALAGERRTVLIHETPPRLAATLAELADTCGGDRRVVVARELTKLHEDVWRGRLVDAASHYSSHAVRGEVVLVLDGAPEQPTPGDEALEEAVRRRLGRGESRRDAAAGAAADLGVSRRRAYQKVLDHAAPTEPSSGGSAGGMPPGRGRLDQPTEEDR